MWDLVEIGSLSTQLQSIRFGLTNWDDFTSKIFPCEIPLHHEKFEYSLSYCKPIEECLKYFPVILLFYSGFFQGFESKGQREENI